MLTISKDKAYKLTELEQLKGIRADICEQLQNERLSATRNNYLSDISKAINELSLIHTTVRPCIENLNKYYNTSIPYQKFTRQLEKLIKEAIDDIDLEKLKLTIPFITYGSKGTKFYRKIHSRIYDEDLLNYLSPDNRSENINSKIVRYNVASLDSNNL